MAAHGMSSATDLADRGIDLFSVQIWRLLTQSPERFALLEQCAHLIGAVRLSEGLLVTA